jgi:hypothetical protein
VPVEPQRGAAAPRVLRSRYAPAVGAPLEVLEGLSPEGMQPVAEILFYLSCPTSLASRTTLCLHLRIPGVKSMSHEEEKSPRLILRLMSDGLKP